MAAIGRGFPHHSLALSSLPQATRCQLSLQSGDWTHLILHNRLLEPRPHHRRRPRLLTPTPDPRPIRCLHRPLLFSLLRVFHQRSVLRAHCGHGQGIGGGGRARSFGEVRRGVVGWDGVVGYHLFGAVEAGLAEEGEEAEGAEGRHRGGGVVEGRRWKVGGEDEARHWAWRC